MSRLCKLSIVVDFGHNDLWGSVAPVNSLFVTTYAEICQSQVCASLSVHPNVVVTSSHNKLHHHTTQYHTTGTVVSY